MHLPPEPTDLYLPRTTARKCGPSKTDRTLGDGDRGESAGPERKIEGLREGPRGMMRGRSWVVLWLAYALGILVWIVARRTSAHVIATELDDLRTERSVLEAERAGLMRRIRVDESRAVLVPRAESLGLRLPADSEIVIMRGPVTERR